MIKYHSVFKFILFVLCIPLSTAAQERFLYQDTTRSPEERTKDLLSRMSVEEKVGQLLCPLGWGMYTKDGKKVNCSDDYKEQINSRYTGMFWATFRADPWTKKTLETGLSPRQAAEAEICHGKHSLGNSGVFGGRSTAWTYGYWDDCIPYQYRASSHF